MNKFILNEEEKLRILNLHESANKRHYLSEQVNTTHDRTYDYKKSGEEYFYKLKNATDWTKASGKGLESIKTKVYKEGGTSKSGWSKYPCVVNFEGGKKMEEQDLGIFYVINGENFFSNGRRTKGDKMVNYSCEDDMFAAKAAFPFTDKVAGDKFRAWMNNYYPKASKIIDLDKSGPFNNPYMKKAWNTVVNNKTSKKLGVSTFGDLYDKQVLKRTTEPKTVKKNNDDGYPLSKNQGAVGKVAYVKGDYVNLRSSPKYDSGVIHNQAGNVKGKNKEIGKVKAVLNDTGGGSKKWYQIDSKYVREDVVTLK